jgi:hypothetical protein
MDMEVVSKILTLIGLVIVGIGLYIAYSTSAKVQTVASWPTAPGYVVESAIMWEVEAGSSQRTSYSYAYRLRVRTDYMIDGQYFSNTTPGIKEIGDLKIFRTDPWKNLPDEKMISLFKQVPQGTTVPVHYNPKNKAESYIFPELPFWNLYTLPFVLTLVGGIFLLIRLWIGSRSSGLM